MEHGSIITQARREDALVLTKQGRGNNFPKLCVAPGRGGGWHSPVPESRTLTSPGSAADSDQTPLVPQALRAGCTQTPLGAARGRDARGGGAPSAQLSSVLRHPPGAVRGVRSKRESLRASPPELGGGVVTFRLPWHRGERAEERSGSGTRPGLESRTSQGPPNPRSLRRRAVTRPSGLGTKFGAWRRGRPRWGRGWALRWAGTWRRGAEARVPLRLSRSTRVRPRGPVGAPPCCRARPRGCWCTQSRVCLAREWCPWLHNSSDGIRPGVVLSRAARKWEFSVSDGSRLPPSWGSGGDARSVGSPRGWAWRRDSVRPRSLLGAGKG